MKRLVARLLGEEFSVILYDVGDRLQIRTDFAAIFSGEVIVTEQSRRIALMTCSLFDAVAVDPMGSLSVARDKLPNTIKNSLDTYLATYKSLEGYFKSKGFTLEKRNDPAFLKSVELVNTA